MFALKHLNITSYLMCLTYFGIFAYCFWENTEIEFECITRKLPFTNHPLRFLLIRALFNNVKPVIKKKDTEARKIQNVKRFIQCRFHYLGLYHSLCNR